ncbi:MAG: sensor histidine kinase, partial [Limisphaerales bacterium]
GNDLLVHIEDNGIGIKMDESAQLFAPFHRLSNSREYAGSGLGLFIVKRNLQQMEGSISLKPSSEGTHFCVRLRQAADESNSQN